VAEQSPEIEQVVRDMIDAVGRSDLEAIGRQTSREAGVVVIGSDAKEWAEGYDEIMESWPESTPDGELGVRVGLDEVKGYREGSVGWATARGYFELENQRVPVRMTVVLHEEDGDWKTVQAHASIGVPNERMLDPMLQGDG
jgi:ketosteroid isomerase-like protein